MVAKIIDGRSVAIEIKDSIKQEVQKLKSSGIFPTLATLLVGDNPASQIYLKNKHHACTEVGILSINHVLAKEAGTLTVLEEIEKLNSDPKIHAILVQLPLPPQIDTEQVLSTLNPKKDVDGFHPENLGRLLAVKNIDELTNRKILIPIPCTPQGILILIQKTEISLAGKNAVVIGRSTIVGKPVAALLLAHQATVTIAHSQTENLTEHCQRADVLIAAVGKARIITSEMVKNHAIVIDVGINRNKDGKICGDVDFEAVKEKAGWITPVPGGVGPMTIAMLLKNTIQLAKIQNGNKT